MYDAPSEYSEVLFFPMGGYFPIRRFLLRSDRVGDFRRLRMLLHRSSVELELEDAAIL